MPEELRGSVLIGAAVAAVAAVVGFGIWLGAWLNEHWGIYAVVPQVAFMLLAVWGLAGEQRRRWEERRARGCGCRWRRSTLCTTAGSISRCGT
ncbi:hypothetical protein [Streptomyces litmocidini]|uniref:hypothetical protein n=1 Tax=Streptomyces litmocidini TaxID=67318 RepID=UPI0036FD0D19